MKRCWFIREFKATLFHFFVLFTLFVFAGGSSADAGLRGDLQDLLEKNAVSIYGTAYSTDPLRDVYKRRNYEPVWVNKKGPVKRARELVDVLANAGEDGLEPLDYLGALPDDWMAANPAEIELVFSVLFRKFGRDLNGGRTTPAISEPDIVIARKVFDLAGWLEEASLAGPETVVRRLRPNHPQYDRLRKILKAYRLLAVRGGWPAISKGPTMKPNMVDGRIVELRANMAGKGYNGLLDVNRPDVYDDRVAKAVSHFQARNGLENDAVVGPKSLAALNISAEERVSQIIVNMERWRWLKRELGSRHVLVNQAGFKMQLVVHGKTVDERRVIVGKAYHKSPMFSDTIRYLDFNPTWTVPRSIAGNEILPKLRQDPGYLARNNYKIYTSWKADAPAMNAHSINWSDVTSKRFPYKIVQQPGERNALGRVKFMFPNSFNVYLHDTPSRALFARAERALSHGCIRVEHPIEFAEILLKADKGTSRSKIDAILDGKKRTRVSLKQPVPVHLTYFTVWVNGKGTPAFFTDVYKRDKLVAKVFFGAV